MDVTEAVSHNEEAQSHNDECQRERCMSFSSIIWLFVFLRQVAQPIWPINLLRKNVLLKHDPCNGAHLLSQGWWFCEETQKKKLKQKIRWIMH